MLKKLLSLTLISTALLGTMIPASAAWKQSSMNNAWNYVKEDRTNATGWQFIDGQWYHFTNGGDMETGWTYDNGAWYYLWSNGTMASNSWVINGNSCYYLGEDGKMVQSNDKTIYSHTYNFSVPKTILSNTSVKMSDNFVTETTGAAVTIDDDVDETTGASVIVSDAE